MVDIKLHSAQMKIFQDKHRFKICCCGRRMGKTHLAAVTMMTIGLQKKGGVGWAVAPKYSQTMIFWRKFKEIIPPEYIMNIKEGDKCIILKNGFSIWMKSGDSPDSLRGEGLDFVVLDEYATMKEEVWTEAIRPALADKKGSAMFIGTPAGKNHFYKLAQQAMSKDFKDYVYFHFTSYANDFIDPAELRELQYTLPELVYKQEILAEFIETGGVVFSNFIEQMVPKNEIEEDYNPEKIYTAGLDLAKHQDFTVLRIADIETGRVVFTDRYSKLDWTYQIDRIKRNLHKYRNPTCYVDSTGVGDPIYDKLRREGMNVRSVKISSVSKPQLIDNLEVLLEDRKYWIPEDEDTKNEYGAFTYKMSDTGYIKYGAPDGFHDDIVMADALCAWGLKRGITTIGMIEGEPSEYEEEERLVDYDSIEDVIGWD